jgi:transposase
MDTTWETLTMSRKEVPRAGLVKAALTGKITNAQGALALHLSLRQFQRLTRRFRTAGARGLLHRARGRLSPRRLPPELRQQVATLLTTTYAGFNDCHFAEKLQEVHQFRVSRASVRRIRRALGLPAKHRRRPPQHRARRTPEAQLGTLVQLDGSPFDWLEGRGPTMTLLGAIDDATSTVLALHFRPTEDLHGYTTLLREVALTSGLPLALYGDRLNVFVRTDAHWTLAEELQGAQEPTHFGRMLQDLGIGFIPAGSPQAKGRIERLWRTLQDRLVSELRLRGISTLEAAQAFLPEFRADFNRRFAHAPAESASAWRRPPRDLAQLLSCRYSRVVARDHTLRLGARWLQIPHGPHGRSYAGCRVELRECLDGRVLAFSQGTLLAVQPAPDPEFVLKPRHAPHSERRRRLHASRSALEGGGRDVGMGGTRPSDPRHATPEPRARRPKRPAPTHPWRRPFPLSRRARTLMAASRG